MDHGSNSKITRKIKVYGIVQGVGFRPLVYHIAGECGICGTVRNIGGSVEIIAQAPEAQINAFLKELQENHSGSHEIVRMETVNLNPHELLGYIREHKEAYIYHKIINEIDNGLMEYTGFHIITSEEEEQVPMLPTDLPVCEECRKELYERSDRRFHNPFISCMHCGPRYTIIEGLPYDRENTVMRDYELCDTCKEEYTSPECRRFHAQTISCNDCGPFLVFRGRKRKGDTKPLDGRCSEGQYREEQYRKEHSWEEKSQDEHCREGHHPEEQSWQEFYTEEYASVGIAKGAISYESVEEKALLEAVKLLKDGGVIAVKGIGGYHFVCSPFREEAVNRLRKLKGREEKPFAVMFGSIASIEEYCQVSEEERRLLESKACPIVLLNPKVTSNYTSIYDNNITQRRNGVTEPGVTEPGVTEPGVTEPGVTEPGVTEPGVTEPVTTELIATKQKDVPSLAPSVNKGSLYIGAFLPYTGVQLELIRHCGPLVMTSGNISDQPIIREDEEMLELISTELDGVLYHTRRIIRSVDDSVVKLVNHRPQMIRRSRGYVPYPVFLPIINRDIPIFAAGGDLKAAYCLYQNGHAVVSQHFGDLGQDKVIREYEASIVDLMHLLKIKPELAVCDLHPNYFSSEYTRTLGIPIHMVQHHHAHVASVMAEHQLQGPVIGVAFDGTGYGTDGNIWGGEFLICTGPEFIRAAHLVYTPMLGGDQSMKDGRKTASCYLIHHGLEEYLRDDRKAVIRAALENKVNTIMTSSMGRLFDAAASILGIHQENRYEGECAVMLEREALLALQVLKTEEQWTEGKRTNEQMIAEQMIVAQKIGRISYPTELSFAIYSRDGKMEIDPKPLLRSLCSLRDSVDTGKLALYFHFAVADMTVRVCRYLRDEMGINSVALCGGVFQNTILMVRAQELLAEEGFLVYVNEAVPPNDGAISLGQTYIGLLLENVNNRM